MAMRFFPFLMFATAALSPAQTRVVPQTFDVVSIKPNLTGSVVHRATTLPGGVFTATNVSLESLMSRAFGVVEAQIEGGPRWIGSDEYDVEARANTSAQMSSEEARPALQAMLADRFELKVHRETRQGQIYSLTIAKGGPKMKEHTGEGQPGISASVGGGKIEIRGTNARVARLAEYLSSQMGRPVADHTGLAGEYDFFLAWASDDAISDDTNGGVSVFAALQEQLGLKVEAAKGPIETIVVDAAEKASAN
jgi:uncharacterized protein (TIGR03435 family)